MFPLWLLLFGAASQVAQRPLTIVRFPLELAELSLAAEPVSGLTMILLPAANSKQGKSPESLVWLRFHPDSALEWINSAAYALAVPVPAGAPDGIQWSRTLNAMNAQGAVTIGRERKKGQLQKARWLAIADSSSGWRFPLTEHQADSLLRLVLHVGSLSRIDTAAATALEADRVDAPVRVLSQARPPFRGVAGRVLLQFVVDIDGRADPASLLAYAVSDSMLVRDAFEVIRSARFEPARRAGQVVRQVVQQVVVWHPERR